MNDDKDKQIEAADGIVEIRSAAHRAAATGKGRIVSAETQRQSVIHVRGRTVAVQVIQRGSAQHITPASIQAKAEPPKRVEHPHGFNLTAAQAEARSQRGGPQVTQRERLPRPPEMAPADPERAKPERELAPKKKKAAKKKKGSSR